MKRAFFSAIVACCALSASAREMTLDECVAYAIDHNLTVRQHELNRQSAEQQVVSAKDAVLPQISAGGQQSWNFGRSLNSQNIYANHNTANFGLSAGLQLPLFNGLQTVRNVDYAKASLVAVVEELEAAKDDIALRVMAQYLQVLYCSELEGVAMAQAELTAEELQRRRALLDAGKIPEADMLDARSQLAQAKLQLVNASNNRRLALLDLAQLLRLESMEDFDVVAIDTKELPLIRDPRSVFDSAMNVNHTIAANRLQITAANKQIELAKTGYIPRLSLNAGLSSNYYRLPGMNNESFAQQFRHNFGQYVGLQLSIPIFDGLQTRNNIRSARIRALSAELNLETQKDNLYKAVNESYYQAVGAREKLAAAEEACEASAAALAAVQGKYEVGLATPIDFENAKNGFVKSMSERAQARYELLLRARILDFYANQ
ncbi:MAG: TolC family protein [Bacteroides sp.]|nr:TolC family protein [Bacteroides sp.]